MLTKVQSQNQDEDEEEAAAWVVVRGFRPAGVVLGVPVRCALSPARSVLLYEPII